jgi:hypothetical protein
LAYLCAVNYPIFVFHELVVRLTEVNPSIGKYLSQVAKGETFILTTVNGTVIVPLHFIQLQYENPKQINSTDLSILAHNFKSDGKKT